MPNRLTKLAVGALALTAFGAIALSQEAPPRPPFAADDPQQLPAIRGEFERLTLTGRGDADGFILKDGTEVKTAPDLSAQIAASIKPGDRVTVNGLRAAAIPLVHAVSITNETRHSTISDSSSAKNPPPPPPPRRAPPPPVAGGGAIRETSGRVRMALHGAQGEVNGALLESGTLLRFPPDPAGRWSALLQSHQPVVAEGVTITNALGTVVDVQQIGPSKERLLPVGPPPFGGAPPPPPPAT